MGIDKVSFTGFTEVGRMVMQAAATSNLKPVTLELGGKSPLIILDDADVDMAVDLARIAIFHNKGEIMLPILGFLCIRPGRHFGFVKKSAEKAKRWKVGDPFDPSVQQGPQVEKTQFEKVLSYIEHGKREGETLLTGGNSLGDKGYYIEPTIFIEAKCRAVDEAIQKANNTRYGLAAGIVTKEINVANRILRSIRTGTIWINCYFAFDQDCPFGGYKMSGLGKGNGLDALDKYLQNKYVVVSLIDTPWL